MTSAALEGKSEGLVLGIMSNMFKLAGSVIISDQEIDENKGEAEIFKILKGKMQTLEETIKENVSSLFLISSAYSCASLNSVKNFCRPSSENKFSSFNFID